MKIAILGGTGSIGEGLALRWAQKCRIAIGAEISKTDGFEIEWAPKHKIIIGSRKIEKAKAAAKEYYQVLKNKGFEAIIQGNTNLEAVRQADVIVLSIPYQHVISTIESIRTNLKNQIVISIVVPMEKDGGYFKCAPIESGSAAMEIRKVLPNTVELVSAFHNVSATKLTEIDKDIDMDVFICGDNELANQVVSDLVKEIPKLRPLIAGPLEASHSLESITPLLINLAILNQKKHLGMKCVGS